MAASLHLQFFQLLRRCSAPRPVSNLYRAPLVPLGSTACTYKQYSVEAPKGGTSTAKIQKISKAMQIYLQNAAKHDAMLKEHAEEFEMGRKYLANMMGADPDSFSQPDIDEAIEYLLPSGLFAPRARPMMKPPEQIFPKKKAAEFDSSGRPHHYLFYTGLPNYYDLMHTVGDKLISLSKSGYNAAPSESSHKFLEGTRWLSKQALSNVILEQINDQLYERFITLITRLADHPLSLQERDFLLQYRVELAATKSRQLPEIKTCPNTERRYVNTIGKRKTAVASLTLWEHGMGNVEINKRDIAYFECIDQREQIMSPLVLTNRLGNVDFSCQVEGSGVKAQAGAVRHALSLALAAFVEPDVRERMRQVGLLTRDVRMRERKKPGQRGAREKKTWKKR